MMLNFRKRRGQALLMVTFALIAMFGLIGLSVDFGWAFYVEKTAQAAADAAAIAAVKKAFNDAGGVATAFGCSGSVVQCYATPVQCPTSGSLPRNLQSACIYAAQNGFTTTNARQNVTVLASDSANPPTVTGCNPAVTHPPTAPCVDTLYWVTVRVAESIPQLFSAILGNTTGLVSARATAAVAESEIIGSLILLNRENDISPETGVGRNLTLGGTPTVKVPGGILLASDASDAGHIQGGGTVESPFTYIRGSGDVQLGGSGSWTAPPENKSDGGMFQDPMRGKGQPPISPTTNYIPDPNGVLTTAQCPGWVCPPGNYYATTTSGGNTVASGDRIVVPNAATASFSGGSFADYVFFGGLLIDRATVDFGPGRYVLAGVSDTDTKVFETTNNAWVTGGTSETSDAGRVFILTDSSYAGQLTSTVSAIPHTRSWTDLQFSDAMFKSGANAQSKLELYGLNPTSANLPSDLETFGPVLIWQDQQNSYIEYTPGGQIDISCTGATLNSPCTNTPSHPEAPMLELHANQRSRLGGVVYQPRGAWTLIQAAPGYTGPLRVISGAMSVQGAGILTLTSPSVPISQLTTALVE